MNTRTRFLALVTLAVLAAACDPQPAPSSVGEPTFRGDELDPPTRTTTGVLLLKGGHDDPEEWGRGFEECSLETQVAFYKRADEVAADVIMDGFVTDENNVEWCMQACEGQHMAWGGDFAVQFLHVEHGRVTGVLVEKGSWGWESEARVTAEISCGCAP